MVDPQNGLNEEQEEYSPEEDNLILDEVEDPPLGCALMLVSSFIIMILGALAGAVMGALVGLPFWLLSGEIFVVGLCAGLFGIVGGLYVFGMMITASLIDHLRSRNFEEQVVPGKSRLMWVAHAVGIFLPPIGVLLASFFSSHRRGRGQRALFAALVGALSGVFFATAVHFIAKPQGPQALTLLEAIPIFAIVFALLGFIIGFCSTDW